MDESFIIHPFIILPTLIARQNLPIIHLLSYLPTYRLHVSFTEEVTKKKPDVNSVSVFIHNWVSIDFHSMVVHWWACWFTLAETICVADVNLHHHTNVLSYSASVSSGRLLLISNPSNHSMFWCLQTVENNQVNECTAKIEIHSSTVGYIDYILFPIHCSELSCTQDNMHPNAIKKMLLKEWKHVLPTTASFTSMTAQMVNKCLHLHVFLSPCLREYKERSIWGVVLFTAWFWPAAKNVWNDLIWWHPTIIVLYHVIQSCRKMTPNIDTNCSTVHIM